MTVLYQAVASDTRQVYTYSGAYPGTGTATNVIVVAGMGPGVASASAQDLADEVARAQAAESAFSANDPSYFYLQFAFVSFVHPQGEVRPIIDSSQIAGAQFVRAAQGWTFDFTSGQRPFIRYDGTAARKFAFDFRARCNVASPGTQALQDQLYLALFRENTSEVLSWTSTNTFLVPNHADDRCTTLVEMHGIYELSHLDRLNVAQSCTSDGGDGNAYFQYRDVHFTMVGL
jgi:hypothetical protein